ncbi:MAG TPA: hypothetical protein ENK11_05485 [Phycisphaerales bacterium]|nr:hypothetical protein [Phycisphaerales bacterium]
MTLEHTSALTLGALALVNLSTIAGDLPPMGGSMNHIMVHLNTANEIEVTVENPGEMVFIDPGETYTGAAAVLNGTRFNAQYGWLVSGLWAPPPGGFVYIDQIDASPTLSVYAGRAFGPYSFMDPILGTGSSASGFAWDGVMLHNYYAVTMPGHYSASYLVYIGDANGEPIAGYSPGEVTLGWVWDTGCAADIAEPFGVLDLADITAFITAFSLGAPAADVAEPLGVFDLADISGFVQTFTAGCD